jgi:hypothetical protein
MQYLRLMIANERNGDRIMKSLFLYIFLSMIAVFILEMVLHDNDLYLLLNGGSFGLLLYIALNIGKRKSN